MGAKDEVGLCHLFQLGKETQFNTQSIFVVFVNTTDRIIFKGSIFGQKGISVHRI